MTRVEKSGQNRSPTPDQLRQERALTLVIWLDMLIIPPYLMVGIAVGSLAIIAEVLRGSLLLFVVVLSRRILRRSNRGLVGDYDYGFGKQERVLSGSVAVLLAITAGFIVWRAFVMHPMPPHSRFLAALAIVLTCLNLGINVAPLVPLWRSIRTQPSLLVLSLFRAGLAKAFGSVIVVSSVTIHALASTPMAGRIAEAVGGLVVAGFMLSIAAGLLREAMPDLLDRTIAEPMQAKVNRTLVEFFHNYDDLIEVRTRRSGNIAHVEITLGFAPDKTLGELSGIIEGMQEHLRQAIPNSDIVIVPRATAQQNKV